MLFVMNADSFMNDHRGRPCTNILNVTFVHHKIEPLTTSTCTTKSFNIEIEIENFFLKWKNEKNCKVLEEIFYFVCFSLVSHPTLTLLSIKPW